MHFFIHNSFHSGDIILTRPFIKALKEKYPDLVITLECRDYNVYLWEDFGLPIVQYFGPDHHTTTPTPNCPPDAIFLNMWFGVFEDYLQYYDITYTNNVLTFYRYMEYYNLHYTYHLEVPEVTPAVEFFHKPPMPFAVWGSGVLIENGPVRSDQSYFPTNDYMQQIATNFPQFIFYCSAKPQGDAFNLVDCSYLNLIQLSEISNQCQALITHGSGPEAGTYTEQNRYKPRCMVGMHCWKIWDDSNVYYANDINEVFNFLGQLPDNQWPKLKQLI